MITKVRLLPILLLTVFLSCKDKESAEPEGQIEGTWKIESLKSKESNGTENDYWVLAKGAFSCVADITYTFGADGKFSTSVPNGCATGAASILGDLAILFQANTGTYTIQGGNALSVAIGESQLAGTISISGNKATVVTPDPSNLSRTITLVFVKV